MSLELDGRRFDMLPVCALDLPVLDVRQGRDPEKLEELARDILRRGLIFPLAVVPDGERYEVIDGVRRYLAAKSAGLEQVLCLIYPTKTAALEGVKYAANAFREDMSPAEEAVFFRELFATTCKGDLEAVAALANKRLGYVQDRIALLDGDELVFQALQNRKIPIGVAHEINKCSDASHRRYFLDCAVRGGATVAMVAGWISDWKQVFGAPQAPPPPDSAQPVAVVGSSLDIYYCVCCRRSDPRFIPNQIAVHQHCFHAVLEPMLDAYHGSSVPERELVTS